MILNTRIAQKLTFLVLAQFLATSLWFAGNAIYPEIESLFHYPFELTPKLTIAVQLGFISGTLIYAVSAIVDRFSPAKVFGISAVLASISNLLVLLNLPFEGLFLSRLGVGFFLAGIYPVGMKIAADWAKDGLGKSLGFLVGALVLGTAFPHLIKFISAGLPWKLVIGVTSGLALISGAIVVLLVGDGPDRTAMTKFRLKAILQLFRNKGVKSAALGYFGHMWELYAFWSFLPAMLYGYGTFTDRSVSLLAFSVIGVGSIGCIAGGLISGVVGSRKVAFWSLLVSGSCALMSGFMFEFAPIFFLTFLFLWGFFVIPDSPQFSAMVANSSIPELKGSALTIVNSIGFTTTIVSIQIIDWMEPLGNLRYSALAIGPILGLLSFRK